MIVDCALYEAGRRQEGTLGVDHALEAARRDPDCFVWIGLFEPTEEEFAEVAKEFELHPLAVEDAIHAQQRPKLDVYGDTLFLVLKPAHHVGAVHEPDDVVELSQIMVFLGANFLITVRHGANDVLVDVRHKVESDSERLRSGPMAALHAIVDRVVDDYGLVLRDLDLEIESIEQAVFSDSRANHAERLYRLKREVLELRQAVAPLADPIETLAEDRLSIGRNEHPEYFRDVHDHVLRYSDRIDTLDALLVSALQANLAQVGIRQNEDMRKISAWVAIIAMPTMIAGVYGMNFEHMPELGWQYGYVFALGLMAVACTGLYLLFRRRKWL